MLTREKVFRGTGLGLLLFMLLVMFCLLGSVLLTGSARLDWEFLSSYPSRFSADSGILPALVGSLYLVILSALISIPLGIGAAIYLEEYAPRGLPAKSRLLKLLELNLTNLAAIPSILVGLLGLVIFVRTVGLGASLLAGALTLALLVLPIVVIASREAIRAVPTELREASLALGASRWQTVWHQVLPQALPGIATGTILSISRAAGETAPLLVVGGLAYVSFLPQEPLSPFSALPVQIFSWLTRPQDEFQVNAAAAITVLLAVIFLLNFLAIWLRYRQDHARQ